MKKLLTSITVILLRINQDIASHYSTTYGINYCSVLESLSFFSVAEGAMVPDIMHDILEGVLPLELKLLITVNVYIQC